MLAGKRVTKNTSSYGAALRLPKQLFPLFVGQPIAIPIRSGILASVVEKTNVVITVLKRLDLALDKTIDLL